MSQTRSTPGSVTRIQSGRGTDGVVRCFDNLEAVRLLSKSDKNPNRWFYKCPKDSQQCKFFKWEDELLPSGSPPHSSQPTPTPSLMPNTLGRTLASPAPGPSQPIPMTTPIKRPIDDDDTSTVFYSDDGEDLTPSPKKLKFTPAVKQTAPGGLKPAAKDQWQSIQDDPDNPFHVTAKNVAATPSSSQRSVDSFATPSSSGQTVVPATPATNGESHPMTSDFLASLQTIGQLPAHLSRLERKLIAAEKSKDAKARRIEQLEAENAALRTELEEKTRRLDQLAVLQATIDALKTT